MTPPILDVVIARLKDCKGEWTRIAAEIEPDNAASYYSWLVKMIDGRIGDPSVNRIQRLFDYFEARETAKEGASHD